MPSIAETRRQKWCPSLVDSRISYVPRTGLAIACAAGLWVAIASTGNDDSCEPAHVAVVIDPAPLRARTPPEPIDPRGPDLDRTQVEAAVAELVGPAPATLGAALGLTSPRPIGAFDEARFDRLSALGDRLHVF